MADRVPVTLRLGGALSADRVPDLMAAIAADDAGADWEGEPVTLDRVVAGETLVLVGTEVAWGIFEEIEGFAQRAGLVYARWSGGCLWQLRSRTCRLQRGRGAGAFRGVGR